VSRWDAATAGKVPAELANRLGIAVGKRAYKAYSGLLASPRWQRAFNFGARPQRLLFASTGTKDPDASDTLYVRGLAAALTINTMPEATLKAFADHGQVGALLSPEDDEAQNVLAAYAASGIDVDALAAKLQEEGARSFVDSWNALMAVIDAKAAAFR
jgi:transaldolase